MIEQRWAYTVTLILATIIAGWQLRKNQASLPLGSREKLILALFGMGGATIAAKLPFVIDAGPASGPWIWLADGKTILWGLVGGYFGVELGKWAAHVQTRTGDSFVVAVCVGIGIGRIGCFLFGCCYGTATDLPWAVCFGTAPDGGMIPRHPAQLYELIFHLSAAMVAAFAVRRRWQRGNLMPWYLVSYAVYRFISETWRPEPRTLGSLTFYQWSAIVIAIVFTSIAIIRRPADK